MRNITAVLAALLLVGIAPRASAVPCDHVDYVVDCGYTVSVPIPSVTQAMDNYYGFAATFYAGEYVLSFETPVGLTELMLVHSSQQNNQYGLFLMGPNQCDDTAVGWATYSGYAPVGITGLGQQQTYYLSIDSTLPVGQDEWTHVTFVCNGTATEFCGNDTVDNDFDGLVDCDDPDCTFYQGCQPFENCYNGLDDNKNGLIDCQDPLCASHVACIPQENCYDGFDNNGDGLADCLAAPLGPDPFCVANSMCPPESDCSNGVDDDYDGYIDCQDSDCPNYPCGEICDNGIDDNFDGWIDCLDVLCVCDPICWGGEICDDGIDNDGDGATDCNDCECWLQGPCLGEVCDNGFDDDGDGFIDCDDPECTNAPNCVANEIGLCNDYLDNDADGFVDCLDPDCFNDSYCTGLCDVINYLPCGAIQQWDSTLAQDSDILDDYTACGGVDTWLHPETSWSLPGSNEGDEIHVTVSMPGQGNVSGLAILEELGGDDCDRYSPCITTVTVGQTAVIVPQPGAEYYAVVESNGIQSQYEIEVQCVSTVEDCSDLWTDNDGDGLLPCDDPDCDGYPFPDEDGDGYDVCDDCYDLDDTVYPGAPEVPCDNIDQDCDGTDVGEIDNDGDGYIDEDCPEGDDCDDNDDQIHPGVPEICDDGVDNDCDGDVDEDDNECGEPGDDDTADDDDGGDDDDGDDDGADDDMGDPPCEGCCCEDCSVQQTRTETGLCVALLLAMTGLLARRRSNLGRNE